MDIEEFWTLICRAAAQRATETPPLPPELVERVLASLEQAGAVSATEG